MAIRSFREVVAMAIGMRIGKNESAARYRRRFAVGAMRFG